MDTTVIIIKGDNSKSLLNDIASALTVTNVAPVKQKRNPYNLTVKATESQLRLIAKFLKNKRAIKFNELKSYVRAADGNPVHNKVLSDELKSKGYNKISLTADRNQVLWITSL